MGANAKMFLDQREFESKIEMGLLTKKETISKGQENAKKIIKDAEVDLFELFSNSARLEEFLKSFNKEIREAILEELNGGEYKARGLEFTTKNGASRMNYKEDEVWSNLNQKIKSREELLKTAYNSKETIYDSEGVEVPKISKTGGRETLNVKY